MSPNRLEAFSDGVFAIAITLLVLDIHVPIPSAAASLADELGEGQGENLAAAIYSGSFLVMSVAFAGTNRHILFAKGHLMAVQLDDAQRRVILTRGITGLVPYALATALAAVSPYVTLAICGAVAMFYALPFASATERGVSPPEPS